MLSIFSDPFVLLCTMIFCHLIDDFGFQGVCLCNMKQKSFWENNAPDFIYENDYIVALVCHAFTWSFMVMLVPMLCGFLSGPLYAAILGINVIVHAFVDNAKANLKIINLVIDQFLHFVQIVVTWSFVLWNQ